MKRMLALLLTLTLALGLLAGCGTTVVVACFLTGSFIKQ